MNCKKHNMMCLCNEKNVCCPMCKMEKEIRNDTIEEILDKLELTLCGCRVSQGRPLPHQELCKFGRLLNQLKREE